MRILAIGDIVGENAVKKIEQDLPSIKQEFKIDFVIANGENAAKARGITKELFERIINAGVNVVTMGNHTYSNKGIYDIHDKRLLVPVNYNQETVENGYGIYECKGVKIFVSNILGKRLGASLNAFNTIDSIISNIDDDVKIRIIDFHGEYGNEKRAMAYFLRHRISAFYGTHTHIETADEKMIEPGVGFITDIGMCGPSNSAIGYDLDFEVSRYKNELSDDSKLSQDENCTFNGCMFEIDEQTGKTISIERINR